MELSLDVTQKSGNSRTRYNNKAQDSPLCDILKTVYGGSDFLPRQSLIKLLYHHAWCRCRIQTQSQLWKRDQMKQSLKNQIILLRWVIPSSLPPKVFTIIFKWMPRCALKIFFFFILQEWIACSSMGICERQKDGPIVHNSLQRGDNLSLLAT